MNPLQFIDENKELLFQTYHDLHHLVEPSWEERKTSKYLRPHFEVPFMMASPVIIHGSATTLVESAITCILGEDMCFPTCVSQGGEDFHFYTAKNPE